MDALGLGAMNFVEWASAVQQVSAPGLTTPQACWLGGRHVDAPHSSPSSLASVQGLGFATSWVSPEHCAHCYSHMGSGCWLSPLSQSQTREKLGIYLSRWQDFNFHAGPSS